MIHSHIMMEGLKPKEGWNSHQDLGMIDMGMAMLGFHSQLQGLCHRQYISFLVSNLKHSSVWQVWIRKFPDNKPFESLASSWPVYPTSAASATVRYDVRGSGGNVRPQFIEAFHQGGHQPQGHVLATAQVGGDLIALCDCVYILYTCIYNNIYKYYIYYTCIYIYIIHVYNNIYIYIYIYILCA